MALWGLPERGRHGHRPAPLPRPLDGGVLHAPGGAARGRRRAGRESFRQPRIRRDDRRGVPQTNRLPRSAGPVALAVPENPAGRSALAMTKVLVVDDTPDMVRLIRKVVEDQGHDVLEADNGPTALAIVAAERPDVILLDVMMPGMDGIEVLRRLKSDDRFRPIPVILVTANGEDRDVIDGLDRVRTITSPSRSRERSWPPACAPPREARRITTGSSRSTGNSKRRSPSASACSTSWPGRRSSKPSATWPPASPTKSTRPPSTSATTPDSSRKRSATSTACWRVSSGCSRRPSRGR